MRRFFNERNRNLLLSLVIATILWAYVTNARSPQLERATVKAVPVVPAIVGEPAFGYGLLGVRVDPPTVSISGDPRLLAPVQKVTTEPINLSGATRDVNQDVAIVTPAGVEVGVRARVSIQIAPVIAATVLRGVRVQVVDAPPGTIVDLQPATVQLRVSGPVMLVTRLRADQFVASVSAADLPPGPQTRPVRVQAPAQIEVLAIEPAQIVITVRRGG